MFQNDVSPTEIFDAGSYDAKRQLIEIFMSLIKINALPASLFLHRIQRSQAHREAMVMLSACFL